jgi:hypothetical protein
LEAVRGQAEIPVIGAVIEQGVFDSAPAIWQGAARYEIQALDSAISRAH